jgi:RimJ/RimL family protein N-acetyltransferase
VRYWPVFGLVLRTPRLELRPLGDDDMPRLVETMLGGVHDPAVMPFAMPWTDAEPDKMVDSALKYWWSARAALTPLDWNLEFAIHSDGDVVGLQGMRAKDFAVVHNVSTGSWLGRKVHGHGIGTEMRAAVLMFAFDHLGATHARSSAYLDNPASMRVSEKLGYEPNGRFIDQRRPGEVAEQQELVVTPDTFRRPDWKIEVEGLEACRAQLGLSSG